MSSYNVSERKVQIYSNAICPIFSSLSELFRKKGEISEHSWTSLYPCVCTITFSIQVHFFFIIFYFIFLYCLILETWASIWNTNNATNLKVPVKMLSKQRNIKGPWNPILQLMSCCFHSLQASCRAFSFCGKSTADIRRDRSTPWSQFISILPATALFLQNKN